MRCGKKESIITLPKSGIGLFPASCALISENIVYFPTFHKEIDKEYTIPKTLSNDLILVPKNSKILDVFRKIDRKIKTSDLDIEELNKQLVDPRNTLTIPLISISLSSVLFFIGILIGVIMMIFKIRKMLLIRSVTANDRIRTEQEVEMITNPATY